MKNLKRKIAILLSISIMLTSAPFGVFAESVDEVIESSVVVETTEESTSAENEISSSEEKGASGSEIISEEMLEDEETLDGEVEEEVKEEPEEDPTEESVEKLIEENKVEVASGNEPVEEFIDNVEETYEGKKASDSDADEVGEASGSDADEVEEASESEIEIKTALPNLYMSASSSGDTFTTNDFLSDRNIVNATNVKMTKLIITRTKPTATKVVAVSTLSNTGLYKYANTLYIYLDGNDKLKIAEYGGYAFNDLKYIEEISGLEYIETPYPEDLHSLFAKSSRLKNVDFTNFDTTGVTNMSEMFSSTGFESIDLSSFDTSSVTDMSKMFYQCMKLTSVDLSSFDTSNVTDMNNMFYGCLVIPEVNLRSFTTEKNPNMSNMFVVCSKLTKVFVNKEFECKLSDMDVFGINVNYPSFVVVEGDINNPYTVSIEPRPINSVFSSGKINFDSVSFKYPVTPSFACKKGLIDEPTNIVFADRTIELEGWYTDPKYTDKWDFANDEVTKDMTLYAKWTPKIQYNIGNATWINQPFTGTVEYRERVVLPTADDILYRGGKLKEWIYSYNNSGYSPGYGMQMTCNATFTPVWDMASDTYDMSEFLDNINKSLYNKITIQKGGSIPSGNIVNGEKSELTHAGLYVNGSEAVIYVREDDKIKLTKSAFKDFNNVTDIVGLEKVDTSELTDFSEMFSGCIKLKNLDMSSFNTLNATTMEKMFYNCTSIENLDIRTFVTSNVTNMKSMFENCASLTNIQTSTGYDDSSSDTTRQFEGCGISSVTDSGEAVVSFCKSVYDGLKWVDVPINGSLQDIYINKNNKITEPNITSVDGFILDGWYQDKEYNGSKWNFNDGVPKSMTLYAKWLINVNYIIDKQTSGVTFNNPQPITQYVYQGKDIIVDLPNAANLNLPNYYTFGIWCTKDDFTGEVENNKVNIVKNNNLYLYLNRYRIANLCDPASIIIIDDPDADIFDCQTKPDKKIISSKKFDYDDNILSFIRGLLVSDYKLLESMIPTHTGYGFVGWYKYDDINKKLINCFPNENDSLEFGNEDEIDLYAVWTTSHTVEFNPMLQGKPISPQNIIHGKKAEYVSLWASDYTLDGWYEDQGFTKKFDFNTPIMHDYILYAKWIAKQSSTNSRNSGSSGGGSSGGGGGGGGGGSAKGSATGINPLTAVNPLTALPQQNNQPTPTKQVTVNNNPTTANTYDNTQATWNFDTVTNTWKLSVKDALGLDTNMTSGFAKLTKTEKQIINNVEVEVPVTEMYCFDENGNMLTGWVQTQDKGWYYFDTTQATLGLGAQNCWKTVDNKQYYFDQNGKMLENTVTPDGHIVGADGAMIS